MKKLLCLSAFVLLCFLLLIIASGCTNGNYGLDLSNPFDDTETSDGSFSETNFSNSSVESGGESGAGDTSNGTGGVSEDDMSDDYLAVKEYTESYNENIEMYKGVLLLHSRGSSFYAVLEEIARLDYFGETALVFSGRYVEPKAVQDGAYVSYDYTGVECCAVYYDGQVYDLNSKKAPEIFGQVVIGDSLTDFQRHRVFMPSQKVSYDGRRLMDVNLFDEVQINNECGFMICRAVSNDIYGLSNWMIIDRNGDYRSIPWKYGNNFLWIDHIEPAGDPVNPGMIVIYPKPDAAGFVDPVYCDTSDSVPVSKDYYYTFEHYIITRM